MSAKPTVNAGLYRHLTQPLTFLTTDPQRRAACADEDPELFFDEDRQTEAAAVCHRCPVRAGCGAWGRSTGAFGVWGGIDPRANTGLSPDRAAEVAARRRDVAELHAAGLGPKEIAARLGIHPDVAYADVARTRRDNIERRYPTRRQRIDAACERGERVLIGPDETNEALDRLDDGTRTLASLTDRLHVSPHTIYRRRQERARARESVAA